MQSSQTGEASNGLFVASTLNVPPAEISRVTLIFARVGWLLASSGAESVITKPAIDFVNVSVRTALFPALSVAVIVIVCFAFVSAVKVFPETESVCVAPSVISVPLSLIITRRSSGTLNLPRLTTIVG